MKEEMSARGGSASGGKIGIDGSRANLIGKTGIEEYAYQIISHLSKHLKGEQVILYVKKGQREKVLSDEKISFPNNWEIKEISFKYLWTQLGLALEMFLNPVDVLFVPAHTVPFIHPKNTIVTIHGLEYEHCPESYSYWGGKFHKFFIRKSCKWASKIVAVSENTKKDLIKLYKIKKEKITVVYNGFEDKSLKAVI
nr:glycosyltransferase [Patescibacteria group bacterium]